jgi:Tfp pilus assembly protein PilN
MVDLIPKQVKRFSNLYRPDFYFYLGLAFVFVSVLSVVLLLLLENNSIKNLQTLEDKINEVGTKEEKIQEAQLLLNKKRIEDFAGLLAERQKTSAVFKIIEESTLPDVWLTKMDVSGSRVELAGQTPNFRILGQQLLVLKDQSLIEQTTLSNLAIGKKGEVEFNLTVLFKPEAFK